MKINYTKSGIPLSAFGLGAMNLPTYQEQANEILKAAIDNQITYIDTADLYQKGKNEAIIGKFLKENKLRQDVIIGSKVGNAFNMNNDEVTWDPSAKHIKEGIINSLKRLNTDYIDLYMLHGGTIEDNKEEVIHTFESLKKEGLIRAYGISSIRPNVIDYYLKHSNIDTIMMQFNLIDNRPERLIDSIESKDVKILARGPLMKGLLTDKYESILDRKFQEGTLDLSYESIKHALETANKSGNLSELSYGYLMQFPVASIVNGASSKAQLLSNIRHFENVMKSETNNRTINDIRKLFSNLEYKDHLV
ncbi:aldo/keto reductase [Macrococcus armenti]|uniref:Aldo/keto reductase n=1 Tax=Macrococcus armenti TaxID=2875764 RepID=A0ABY3ZTH6_9STAP|nr:aldo/keto reductase [Macrococcus armenti]UOB19689.1 aldo/keto reductase [Macrococcus armenti]